MYLLSIINYLDDYDKVGSNLNVIAEPSIVKFSGFEVGKLNVLRVRIINKNSLP